MKKLVEIVDILLGPEGCSWDKKQSISSLKKYLLEETAEAAQAIENKDYDNLKEELGDVLYNIIFIIKLAENNNYFNLDDVIKTVAQKLIRRHPHIFHQKKNLTPEEVKKQWREIKAKEKAGD